LLTLLSCADIWGIGERKAVWLKQQGITQAIQFRDAQPWWVKQHLTVVSARTQLELRGTVAFPIITERATYKEIMVARAFGQPIYKQDELAQASQYYMARAAEKLRGNQLVARRVSVSVMINPFRKLREFGEVEVTKSGFIGAGHCSR
jgi:DNA polymerase V